MSSVWRYRRSGSEGYMVFYRGMLVVFCVYIRYASTHTTLASLPRPRLTLYSSHSWRWPEILGCRMRNPAQAQHTYSMPWSRYRAFVQHSFRVTLTNVKAFPSVHELWPRHECRRPRLTWHEYLVRTRETDRIPDHYLGKDA